MNILYSAADISIPGYDGGSAHATSVITAFLEEDYKITLISKKKGNKLTHRNLTNFRVAQFRNSLFRNTTFLLRSFLLSSYALLTRKIDIVYERGRIFGGGAVLAGWLFRKPIIYEMNEPLGNDKTILGKLIEKWNKSVMRKATLITGMHESFFNDASKNKYLIITNAANPNIFSPQIECDYVITKYDLTRGKTILYSGSFAPWHACENMISAARKLIAKDRKIKFLLIGDGQKYNSCKQLIEKYGIENNIILTGNIPYSEMPAYINAADICLALFDKNYYEYKETGYYYSPVKLFEYLACGKPVVASDIGNIKQLITNKNGLLVDESDLNDISFAISKLLQNKSRYGQISKNNRKLILEKYNWKNINNQILSGLAKRT